MGEQTQITDKYQKLSENRLSYGPADSLIFENSFHTNGTRVGHLLLKIYWITMVNLVARDGCARENKKTSFWVCLQ